MMQRQFIITDDDNDFMVIDYTNRSAIQRYIYAMDREVPCTLLVRGDCLYRADVTRIPDTGELSTVLIYIHEGVEDVPE